MALSSDPLIALAAMNLEVTLLPFILTVWLNNWCLSSIAVIFFEIAIREGFSISK